MNSLIKKLSACDLSRDQLLPLLEPHLSKKHKNTELAWVEVAKRLLSRAADGGSEVLLRNASTVIKMHLEGAVKRGLKNPKQLSQKYSNGLNSLLTHLHFTMEDTNLPLTEMHNLSSLILAAVIDLSVVSYKKGEESSVVSKIFMKLTLVFGQFQEQVLDALLHCSTLIRPSYRRPAVQVPLIQRLFSTMRRSESMSPELYLKYLLLAKLWLFMAEKKELGQTRTYIAKVLRTPKGVAEWAESRDVPWLALPRLNTRLILKNMTLAGALETFYGQHKDISKGSDRAVKARKLKNQEKSSASLKMKPGPSKPSKHEGKVKTEEECDAVKTEDGEEPLTASILDMESEQEAEQTVKIEDMNDTDTQTVSKLHSALEVELESDADVEEQVKTESISTSDVELGSDEEMEEKMKKKSVSFTNDTLHSASSSELDSEEEMKQEPPTLAARKHVTAERVSKGDQVMSHGKTTKGKEKKIERNQVAGDEIMSRNKWTKAEEREQAKTKSVEALEQNIKKRKAQNNVEVNESSSDVTQKRKKRKCKTELKVSDTNSKENKKAGKVSKKEALNKTKLEARETDNRKTKKKTLTGSDNSAKLSLSSVLLEDEEATESTTFTPKTEEQAEELTQAGTSKPHASGKTLGPETTNFTHITEEETEEELELHNLGSKQKRSREFTVDQISPRIRKKPRQQDQHTKTHNPFLETINERTLKSLPRLCKLLKRLRRVRKNCMTFTVTDLEIEGERSATREMTGGREKVCVSERSGWEAESIEQADNARGRGRGKGGRNALKKGRKHDAELSIDVTQASEHKKLSQWSAEEQDSGSEDTKDFEEKAILEDSEDRKGPKEELIDERDLAVGRKEEESDDSEKETVTEDSEEDREHEENTNKEFIDGRDAAWSRNQEEESASEKLIDETEHHEEEETSSESSEGDELSDEGESAWGQTQDKTISEETSDQTEHRQEEEEEASNASNESSEAETDDEIVLSEGRTSEKELHVSQEDETSSSEADSNVESTNSVELANESGRSEDDALDGEKSRNEWLSSSWETVSDIESTSNSDGDEAESRSSEKDEDKAINTEHRDSTKKSDDVYEDFTAAHNPNDTKADVNNTINSRSAIGKKLKHDSLADLNSASERRLEQAVNEGKKSQNSSGEESESEDEITVIESRETRPEKSGSEGEESMTEHRETTADTSESDKEISITEHEETRPSRSESDNETTITEHGDTDEDTYLDISSERTIDLCTSTLDESEEWQTTDAENGRKVKKATENRGNTAQENLRVFNNSYTSLQPDSESEIEVIHDVGKSVTGPESDGELREALRRKLEGELKEKKTKATQEEKIKLKLPRELEGIMEGHEELHEKLSSVLRRDVDRAIIDRGEEMECQKRITANTNTRRGNTAYPVSRMMNSLCKLKVATENDSGGKGESSAVAERSKQTAQTSKRTKGDTAQDPVSRMMNNLYKTKAAENNSRGKGESNTETELKATKTQVSNEASVSLESSARHQNDKPLVSIVDSTEDESVEVLECEEEIECVLENILQDTGRVASIQGIRERLLSESSVKEEVKERANDVEENKGQEERERTRRKEDEVKRRSTNHKEEKEDEERENRSSEEERKDKEMRERIYRKEDEEKSGSKIREEEKECKEMREGREGIRDTRNHEGEEEDRGTEERTESQTERKITDNKSEAMNEGQSISEETGNTGDGGRDTNTSISARNTQQEKKLGEHIGDFNAIPPSTSLATEKKDEGLEHSNPLKEKDKGSCEASEPTTTDKKDSVSSNEVNEMDEASRKASEPKSEPEGITTANVSVPVSIPLGSDEKSTGHKAEVEEEEEEEEREPLANGSLSASGKGENKAESASGNDETVEKAQVMNGNDENRAGCDVVTGETAEKVQTMNGSDENKTEGELGKDEMVKKVEVIIGSEDKARHDVGASETAEKLPLTNGSTTGDGSNTEAESINEEHEGTLMDGVDEAYEASSDASEDSTPRMRRRSRPLRKSCCAHQDLQRASDSDSSPVRAFCQRTSMLDSAGRLRKRRSHSCSLENVILGLKHTDNKHQQENEIIGLQHTDNKHQPENEILGLKHTDDKHQQENEILGLQHTDNKHQQENEILGLKHIDRRHQTVPSSENETLALDKEPSIRVHQAVESCRNETFVLEKDHSFNKTFTLQPRKSSHSESSATRDYFLRGQRFVTPTSQDTTSTQSDGGGSVQSRRRTRRGMAELCSKEDALTTQSDTDASVWGIRRSTRVNRIRNNKEDTASTESEEDTSVQERKPGIKDEEERENANRGSVKGRRRSPRVNQKGDKKGEAERESASCEEEKEEDEETEENRGDEKLSEVTKCGKEMNQEDKNDKGEKEDKEMTNHEGENREDKELSEATKREKEKEGREMKDSDLPCARRGTIKGEPQLPECTDVNRTPRTNATKLPSTKPPQTPEPKLAHHKESDAPPCVNQNGGSVEGETQAKTDTIESSSSTSSGTQQSRDLLDAIDLLEDCISPSSDKSTESFPDGCSPTSKANEAEKLVEPSANASSPTSKADGTDLAYEEPPLRLCLSPTEEDPASSETDVPVGDDFSPSESCEVDAKAQKSSSLSESVRHELGNDESMMKAQELEKCKFMSEDELGNRKPCSKAQWMEEYEKFLSESELGKGEASTKAQEMKKRESLSENKLGNGEDAACTEAHQTHDAFVPERELENNIISCTKGPQTEKCTTHSHTGAAQPTEKTGNISEPNEEMAEEFFEGEEMEVLSTSGIDEEDDEGTTRMTPEALDDEEGAKLDLLISKKSLRSHIRQLRFPKDGSGEAGSREGKAAQVPVVKVQCLSEVALTKEVLISPDVSDEECELVSPGVDLRAVKYPIEEDGSEGAVQEKSATNLCLPDHSDRGILSPHKLIPEEQDETTVPRNTDRSLSKTSSVKKGKSLSNSPSFNTNATPHKLIPEEQDESTVPRNTDRSLSKTPSVKKGKNSSNSPSLSLQTTPEEQNESTACNESVPKTSPTKKGKNSSSSPSLSLQMTPQKTTAGQERDEGSLLRRTKEDSCKSPSAKKGKGSDGTPPSPSPTTPHRTTAEGQDESLTPRNTDRELRKTPTLRKGRSSTNTPPSSSSIQPSLSTQTSPSKPTQEEDGNKSPLQRPMNDGLHKSPTLRKGKSTSSTPPASTHSSPSPIPEHDNSTPPATTHRDSQNTPTLKNAKTSITPPLSSTSDKLPGRRIHTRRSSRGVTGDETPSPPQSNDTLTKNQTGTHKGTSGTTQEEPNTFNPATAHIKTHSEEESTTLGPDHTLDTSSQPSDTAQSRKRKDSVENSSEDSESVESINYMIPGTGKRRRVMSLKSESPKSPSSPRKEKRDVRSASRERSTLYRLNKNSELSSEDTSDGEQPEKHQKAKMQSTSFDNTAGSPRKEGKERRSEDQNTELSSENTSDREQKEAKTQSASSGCTSREERDTDNRMKRNRLHENTDLSSDDASDKEQTKEREEASLDTTSRAERDADKIRNNTEEATREEREVAGRLKRNRLSSVSEEDEVPVLYPSHRSPPPQRVRRSSSSSQPLTPIRRSSRLMKHSSESLAVTKGTRSRGSSRSVSSEREVEAVKAEEDKRRAPSTPRRSTRTPTTLRNTHGKRN